MTITSWTISSSVKSWRSASIRETTSGPGRCDFAAISAVMEVKTKTWPAMAFSVLLTRSSMAVTSFGPCSSEKP